MLYKYLGKPTEVSCEVFIRSFGSISEKTMVSEVLIKGKRIYEFKVFFIGRYRCLLEIKMFPLEFYTISQIRFIITGLPSRSVSETALV